MTKEIIEELDMIIYGLYSENIKLKNQILQNNIISINNAELLYGINNLPLLPSSLITKIYNIKKSIINIIHQYNIDYQSKYGKPYESIEVIRETGKYIRDNKNLIYIANKCLNNKMIKDHAKFIILQNNIELLDKFYTTLTKTIIQKYDNYYNDNHNANNLYILILYLYTEIWINNIDIPSVKLWLEKKLKYIIHYIII